MPFRLEIAMYAIAAAGMHTRQFISSFVSDRSHRPIIDMANAEKVAGRSFIIGDSGDEFKANLLLVFLAR